MTTSNETVLAARAAPRRQRRRLLVAVAAAVAVAAVAYGTYYALVLSRYESTDNAYVQGNLVQITPQVSGTVIAIGADDTDFVKAGQDLVTLDTADAQVALEQTEAQLAQAVREVRSLYASNGALAAQVSLREAEIAKAQADVAKAEDDLQRRAALTATGAVGKEEFNHATTHLASARSALAAAQAALVAAREQ
ncbi:MAG: biotin/lipoyl-binding protein, partial [Rhizobacter sp.]